jgi:hypothetical protein
VFFTTARLCASFASSSLYPGFRPLSDLKLDYASLPPAVSLAQALATAGGGRVCLPRTAVEEHLDEWGVQLEPGEAALYGQIASGSSRYGPGTAYHRRWHGAGCLQEGVPWWQRFVHRGCGPTLPSSANYRLLHGDGRGGLQYASTRAYLAAFDIPMQDPRWDVIQRELSPAAAQRVICQGVSARCTRLLYAAMRARSPALRGLQSWRVATACTGGDLMLSGLDAAGIQYRVVQASELKSTTVGRASRKVINALYEGDGFRLFDDACSEDAIGGAASDLFAMGFPCTKFSTYVS